MAAPAANAPIPYVLLLGAGAHAPDGILEEDSLRQILHWSGFNTANQQNAVMNDGMMTWDDVQMLTTNDIDGMAKTFGSRPAASRIYFGTRRTKALKAITHWVQDFSRVSGTPSIVGLDQPEFKAQLTEAETREKVRLSLKKQTSTSADAASPGPLNKENIWKEWEEKFTNFTRAHLGVNGVPLSYVIRENDAPDVNGTFTDFISKTIACAPHQGAVYEADRLSVFNFIISFTTGHQSGTWVKATMRAANGRTSMEALRAHFKGEGNATRSLADAEKLNATLHYKSERSMTFETYLTRCQTMHTIFFDEGEAMSEEAKIRFLFKTVQHPQLIQAVEALKVSITSGTNMTYTTCCNHLATSVSELPEFQTKRNVSGLNTTGGDKNDSIYNKDGSINAKGDIAGWNNIPLSEKRKVYKERKRLGIKYGGAKKRDSYSGENNTVKQLKSQLSKQKRLIKSLKRGDTKDGKDDDSDDEASDAGDEFGGKSSKKKKVRISNN